MAIQKFGAFPKPAAFSAARPTPAPSGVPTFATAAPAAATATPRLANGMIDHQTPIPTNASYGSGNPWFDQRSDYGVVGGRSLYDSNLMARIQNDNVPAEWTRLVERLGLGGSTRRDQFAQNQKGRMAAGFQAAQLTNPDLRIRDYLRDFDRTKFDRAWASQTPDQRGSNMQTRTSVIRRG